MRELNGMLTALVTPFKSNDTVDFDGMIKNIEYQLKNGVDGILLTGSTGEAFSLNEEERRSIVEEAVKVVAGRGHVLVGVMTETTSQAVCLAQHAEKAGADAIMVAPASYCKCDWEMIRAHVKKICLSVSLPAVIYNNYYATNIDISADQMVELVNTIPNATHVKECSYNSIQRTRDIIMNSPKKVKLVAGWDDIALETFFVGATCWTSLGANTVPEICVSLYKKAMAGEWDQAWKAYKRVIPYFEYFMRIGPAVPILKYANELLGIIGGTNRGPRIDLNDNQKIAVKKHLTNLGVI